MASSVPVPLRLPQSSFVRLATAPGSTDLFSRLSTPELRHDFGAKLKLTRCSECQGTTRNRGCRCSQLIYCRPCFTSHVTTCEACGAQPDDDVKSPRSLELEKQEACGAQPDVKSPRSLERSVEKQEVEKQEVSSASGGGVGANVAPVLETNECAEVLETNECAEESTCFAEESTCLVEESTCLVEIDHSEADKSEDDQHEVDQREVHQLDHSSLSSVSGQEESGLDESGISLLERPEESVSTDAPDTEERVAVVPQVSQPPRQTKGRVAAKWAVGGAAIGGTSGGAAGLTAGGAIGAAIGVIPAIFTFGLSIPVFAAIGGGAGLCAGTAVGSTAGLVVGGAAGYGVASKIENQKSKSSTTVVEDAALFGNAVKA